MEELKQYIESKIKYCEEMRENYPIEKYSKSNGMTEEQMSGYYQGMGEWLHAIRYQMEADRDRKDS